MTCLNLTRLRECKRGLVLGACLSAILSGGAVAETPEPQRISLEWALRQTLEQNATLKTFPYQLRISDAEILQASQRPLPTLGLELENVAGGGDFSGTDNAELTLTLGRTLELGGKRQGRVALASAKKQRQQADYELSRLDVLAETGRRYYRLLRVQLLQGWIQRRIQSERAALAVIEARAEAGAAGKADVSKMRLRLARSQARASQLGGDAAFARAQLAAMWAATPAFTSAAGDLLRLPAVPDQARLAEALAQSPQLLRQQALQRLAEARLQLARAHTRNNLDLDLGVRHLEETSDQALVLSLSMPFGNPNRGALAAAEAAQALSDAEAMLAARELEVSLFGMQQALINQRNYARLTADSLLPQARQLLADTKAGYAQGSYNVLQWADAQAERFDLERELIETHTRIYLHLLELERMTGQSLVSPPLVQKPSIQVEGDQS